MLTPALGTNTYIVGSQNPYTLIDTAEGHPSYISFLSSALQTTARPLNPSQPDVSDIIISHWHQDHMGGIPPVLELLKQLWMNRNPGCHYLPPRVHKYLISGGENGSHRHSSRFNTLSNLLENLSKDLYTPAPKGGVFHDLQDGQTFYDPNGVTLFRVLHTPGHTLDSISLLLPSDKALYTADTVLGHGTTVFEDFAAYISSLKRLLELVSDDSTPSNYTVLYPAHGDVVVNGREKISAYIQHRLDREQEILEVLQTPVPPELLGDTASGRHVHWTVRNIVRMIYKDYPESLWPAACRGVDLHLLKLQKDGIVSRIAEGADQWTLLPSSLY